MEELLKAFEAAIRRVVQEELKAKSLTDAENLFAIIDQNTDKFDNAVLETMTGNSRFRDIVEETVNNADIDDAVKEACRKLTFTTEVSRY